MSDVLDERVEGLDDEELEAELTVAAHDPVRRIHRYESLVAERSNRRRRGAFRPHRNPRKAEATEVG